MSKMLKVQTGDKGLVGWVKSKSAYHAFNYKYVIPQVSRYSLCPSSCCARFSFASMDVGKMEIVAGEYSSDSVPNGRLHSWPIDSATGKLVTKGGAATAQSAYLSGVRKMQGGTIISGRPWISVSQAKSSLPTSPGSLYTALPGGKIATYRYPYPPEDLHFSASPGQLWSHTENPNKRYVFSVKPAKLLGGCK